MSYDERSGYGFKFDLHQAVEILDGWEYPLGKGNVINRKILFKEGTHKMYMVQDEQGNNAVYEEHCLKAIG